MRTTTDLPDVQPRPTSTAASTGRTLGRKWWQRPWIAPLAIISILFVAFSLPPYLSLNPERSRVPQPDDFAAHYPFLVVHVVFGAVALLTTWLQVWPWFRQRHPVAHRLIGRVYVFGGVLPAGLTGLVIGVFTPFGPVARMSTVLLSLLWLSFTVIGYRRARQRRYVEHRRWMIRSFALTASTITNRLWGVLAYLVLAPQLETTFEGSEKMLSWTIAGLTTWLGWVVPLLIAEWWLERGESARHGARLPATLAPPSLGPA
ncbi:DUF2306 domain-containing protein [Archangium lansingense]|uniref:DUF2306 domain-containing protein n=1 Tax=Archangium lansingense TaxID=2995310 RepID=A0ABT3ZZX0_9BACT|nr:DUF2306 domain-containing protein [Archangium lansinium]MCY1074242.1 DUF2306 domain-containing protein [Archangium lansinium]